MAGIHEPDAPGFRGGPDARGRDGARAWAAWLACVAVCVLSACSEPQQAKTTTEPACTVPEIHLGLLDPDPTCCADLPDAVTPGELLVWLADDACCRPPCCATPPPVLANLPRSVCLRVALMSYTGDWKYDLKPLRGRLNLALRGKVHYDAHAAARCLRALRGQGLDVLQQVFNSRWPTPDGVPRPDGCDEVFQGDLPKDATCSDDVECASGLCWGCPPRCIDHAASRGEPCGRTARCGDHDVCINGVCQPYTGKPVPIGAPCEGRRSGWGKLMALCDYRVARCVDGTCKPLKAVGETCASADECAARACVAGKCQQALPRGSKGAPCQFTNELWDCGPSQMCAVEPDSPNQEGVCTDTIYGPCACGTTTCPAGYLCDDVAKSHCVRIHPDGEACVDHPYCNGACNKGRCEPFDTCADPVRLGVCNWFTPLLGDGCTTPDECMSTDDPMLRCDGGVCARDGVACEWKQ